ncbi:MAG: S9 family peptidase [Prevotella bivia]|uniref:Dipeptidyl aminopeptidase/acylaminoacyl peptidase n=1 Tax=Prevotella bivia DSM 20514 TaxID=868129 RepID=I4ZC05_9BACT|nr:S9 family peptidase [Prevotella bivia]EFB93660.1 peptidase, S9A/B/C family, catalytic domain protein [Prevotella bivia JCVIHMP010]EIM33747.1 dipeptidyl aminopeptidase/acylaminoacyl peptidase [Prevotella bivia DSM 20514]MDU6554653.1 S9 family peptidase [Prevotella bivia]MDZ3817762.1 S9 family peptidase [Prevotella bivia]
MNKGLVIAMTAALLTGSTAVDAQDVNIGKSNIVLSSDVMTPEALWAMGRIASVKPSPDGKNIVYQVGYYSVKENKGHQVLRVMDATGKNDRLLTTSAKSESDPIWLDNNTIAYLSGGQLWTMNANGGNRKQLTHSDLDIEGFKFSPNKKQVVLIKSIPYYGTIAKNPDDLDKTTGLLINDMNYRHWDHYVQTNTHPFLAEVTAAGVSEGVDIMEGEPFESPVAPFGGIEQIDWSKDSKKIAYTSRKKEGVQYAISTDTDIYLYDIASKTTINLCKPAGYQEPKIDATKSMRNQEVNHQAGDMQVGYDVNPQFSPDGKYIAWQSMKNNGYESDRNRLCVMDIATGKKTYVTEKFDSNVDGFIWAANSKDLYFIGCWHACINIYQTNLKGDIKQLTEGQHDYASIDLLGSTGKQLVALRHSMSAPNDIFIVTPSKKEKASTQTQISFENKQIFDQLALANVTDRWVKTTDGKDMQVWIITPPHFDPNKKYPTLLYCEGGPQSPVSQFWSFRWNFQMMAANGYVIVAPNRRGLPGYGSQWNEQISSDWTGQCMNDYLSAIDDAVANLPYVDKDRLGAVGASFGGFSVYYLAGHHNKRFKCFISHDGAFNLESMYTDTEEAWFSNWEYDDAYWNKDRTAAARKTYENSPHLNVDKWDTPILCIHGEKDYRINATQGMGAFNAARLRGIPAQLLLFPDENHWVLKPQNGILWQRTFKNWLDQWLKK